MRHIEYLVIHTSASWQHWTAEMLKLYFKRTLQWKRPGYHVTINHQGIVKRILSDSIPSNGVQPYRKNGVNISNANSVNICWIGGITKNAKGQIVPIDNRTDINVKQGALNIASNGNYEFSPTQINNSQNISFEIQNTGQQNLLVINFSTATIGTGFSLNEPSFFTVANASSRFFTVTFQPTSSNFSTVNITITNNDADENPYFLTIAGRGSFLHQGGEDYEALKALYNNAGGVNWSRKTNWDFSGSVPVTNDWMGIKIVNGRVVEVNLNDNNLLGTVPADIANLTALQLMDLRNNKIQDLQDISALGNKVIEIKGNQLDFAEIATSEVALSSYNPQYNDFTTINIVNVGDNVSINSGYVVANNHIYEWSKQGDPNPLEFYSCPTYDFTSVQGGDADTYRVKVMTSSAPFMTILKRDYVLRVGSASPNATDLDILLQFKSVADPAGTLNWSLSEPVTNWDGVLLNSFGRVSKITLANKGLSGFITARLKELSSLGQLDLSGNRLAGQIPNLTNVQNAIDIRGNLFNAKDFTEVTNNFTTVISDKFSYDGDVILSDVFNAPAVGVTFFLTALTHAEAVAVEPTYTWERGSTVIAPSSITGLDNASLGTRNLKFTNSLDTDHDGAYTVKMVYASLPAINFIRNIRVALGANAPQANQLNALLAFNSATGAKLNWKSNVPVASWQGVIFDQFGKVETINIPRSGITILKENTTGDLTPVFAELAKMDALKKLNLSNHDFSGYIPLSTLATLTALEEINLQGNKLQGTLLNDGTKINQVPDFETYSSNIKKLFLDGNRFEKLLVFDKTKLTNLEEISLSNNHLSFTEIYKNRDIFESPVIYKYSPQNITFTTFATVGDALVLDANVEDTELKNWNTAHKTYQWAKAEEPSFNNAGNPMYTKAIALFEDTRLYTTKIDVRNITTFSSTPLDDLKINKKLNLVVSANSLVQAEFDALMEFFTAAGGLFWKNNQHWGDVVKWSNWDGVTVDNVTKQVTEIRLPDNDLRGYIAPEIGILQKLKVVNLQNNYLTDGIPKEI